MSADPQLALFRLWVAAMETGYYAGLTISARIAMMNTALLQNGTLPAAEVAEMVAEKPLACATAMGQGWLALVRGMASGSGDAVAVSRAMLQPFHRATRRNARRLSR
jgi:hypothetical protein